MTWTRHDEPSTSTVSAEDEAARRTRRAFLAGAGGLLAGAVLISGERSRAGATEAPRRAVIPAGATPSTPASGITRQDLGRGTVSRGGTIKVDEGKDVVMNKVSIAPGGDAGWHTHPGDEVIVVTAGTLTFLRQDGPTCVTEEIKAGQAFLGAAAGQVHTAFNHGSGAAEAMVVFVGVPVGESPRADADKPTALNC